MTFEKCMGDPRGHGVVYMKFGKYMGTQGCHKGSFLLDLVSVWGPLGVIRDQLYEV